MHWYTIKCIMHFVGWSVVSRTVKAPTAFLTLFSIKSDGEMVPNFTFIYLPPRFGVVFATSSRFGAATCLFFKLLMQQLFTSTVFLCLQSVLFIIVFVKFYITWKRSSTVDRHQCWLTAGARSHARNIHIANEHAFFLSVHFILVTVMLYRWAQIFFLLFVFLVSTDNCEWKRTHGQW